MQKRYIVAVGVFALLVVGYKITRTTSLNAEHILAHSVFKERHFQGKVQELSILDNKVKAYYMEEHSVPLVSLSFGFANAGKAYEPKEGVGIMTESVLTDGAGTYTRQELRNVMKEKGIKVGIGVTKDRLEFSLSYVKTFEQEAKDILKSILYKPLLNDEDMNLARQQLTYVKKRQKESPEHQLNTIVRTNFYGSHPYGRDSIPDKEALEDIKATDIREYIKNYATKDNLTIGLTGDISKAEAEDFLTDIFGDLKDEANREDLPQFVVKGIKASEPSEISAQSFVLMIAKGIKRLDSDFYPIYIADYIFGGSGLNSRLNKAVREKEGLTYGIYSYLSNSDAVDLWQIYFSATPDNIEKIMKITADEYTNFYHKGITEEELIQAKNSLLSSFNLRFASLANIADMLKQMQVQKLGIDFLEKRQSMIQKVTRDDVNTAILHHFPKGLNIEDNVSYFEIDGKLSSKNDKKS